MSIAVPCVPWTQYSVRWNLAEVKFTNLREKELVLNGWLVALSNLKNTRLQRFEFSSILNWNALRFNWDRSKVMQNAYVVGKRAKLVTNTFAGKDMWRRPRRPRRPPTQSCLAVSSSHCLLISHGFLQLLNCMHDSRHSVAETTVLDKVFNVKGWAVEMSFSKKF